MTKKSSHGIQKRRSTFLPHWEQDGAFLFITFRAADSLPPSAIEKLASERRELERRVARGDLKAGEDLARFNKLFSKKIEDLLDECAGERVLRNNRAAKIVADALLHFDGVRYLLHAWCIMPNHVHVILKQYAGWGLDKILKSWKTYTARKINELLGRRGSFWQQEYFDRLIRDAEELRRAVQYVLENPVKIGNPSSPWVDVRIAEGF